jgi:hypothetical protein
MRDALEPGKILLEATLVQDVSQGVHEVIVGTRMFVGASGS